VTGYASRICSPLDTPKGLKRGYFFSQWEHYCPVEVRTT
jgi:hypothetical protein